MIDLIVTRHPGLVQYLKKIGLASDMTEVINHISDPTILTGKHVCGVLPHSLSCLCSIFTEVPLLNLPAELRGKELSFSEIEKYAGNPVSYNVSVI